MLPPICLKMFLEPLRRREALIVARMLVFAGVFEVLRFIIHPNIFVFFAGKQLKLGESFMAQINKNHNPASMADSRDDRILVVVRIQFSSL